MLLGPLETSGSASLPPAPYGPTGFEASGKRKGFCFGGVLFSFPFPFLFVGYFCCGSLFGLCVFWGFSSFAFKAMCVCSPLFLRATFSKSRGMERTYEAPSNEAPHMILGYRQGRLATYLQTNVSNLTFDVPPQG